MTRIVLVDLGNKRKYESYWHFELIYKDDYCTIVMIQNETARVFIPCDTTTLTKNLNTITFYSKKKDRGLLKLNDFINQICRLKICSPFYRFHPITVLKNKRTDDCVALLDLLVKKEKAVYSWYSSLEKRRRILWERSLGYKTEH